jgi:hypothetical protein
MSGIYQKQVNSGSVASPSAGSTLISVNDSGELFTKDSSGNVTLYSSGSGSPFPFTGSADISGTLNIDFTDTLSYVTGDEEIGVGLQNFGDWVVPIFSGSVIGSKLTQDSASIYNITGDGLYVIPGFGLVTAQIVGSHLNITDGILSGSSLSNIIVTSTYEGTPSYEQVNSSTYVDPVSGDITRIAQAYIMDEPGSTWDIKKINDSGEGIILELASDTIGFNLSNDYSDNTASVLRIEDNNGDAILEFFNDYLVSETIPALDYADDAAAALGGVPVGGIYHNSGTIRIRLV